MSDKERKAEREAADELERLAKAEETRGKVKEKKASKEVESQAGREEIEVEAEEIEEEIEEEKGVRGKNVVRKHGVFIGERKHIEVGRIRGDEDAVPKTDIAFHPRCARLGQTSPSSMPTGSSSFDSTVSGGEVGRVAGREERERKSLSFDRKETHTWAYISHNVQHNSDR